MGCLMFFSGLSNFCYQLYTELNPLEESRLFVIPTESTDSVDDFIDLLQWLPVHEPVEFLEVGFDGCGIEAAGLVIGIEQSLDDEDTSIVSQTLRH